MAWLQIWLPKLRTVVYSLSFIKKNWNKFVILHKHLVFNFVKANFYENDVLFDYSIKISGFMRILGLCADVFRATCSYYWLQTLGSDRRGGFWGLKFNLLHFHNKNNLLLLYIEPNIRNKYTDHIIFIKINLHICVHSLHPLSLKIEVDMNLMRPSDVLFFIATMIRGELVFRKCHLSGFTDIHSID